MLVFDMVQWAVIMETARKITVEVPEALLEKAQEAIGGGITEAVRTGLRLVAASRAYGHLRTLRGKVRFSRTPAELKADR
jgi:Arc/MetJ-type ribon-helix-helix transcriptional regulator